MTFLLRSPTRAEIEAFLSRQRDANYSYPEVGGSRDSLPRGYTVDHTCVRLGTGGEIFARAQAAVREWRMFALGWVELLWPTAPIAAGVTVGVLGHHLGLVSLNACRIVYVLDEDGLTQRYGFAYGTLADHLERGEERFMVEWRHADDSVWYDILAFSQPRHWLVRLGYPVSRLLQKHFARDSTRAMLHIANHFQEPS